VVAAGATPARAVGGLGRGLAGILGDVQPPLASRRRGLQQLLGRGFERSLSRIRQFVTDTALAAIAEGFEAEAVVIARRDGIGLPAVVSSRIPPSWEEAPSLTFELFGQLWRMLDDAASERTLPAAGVRRSSGMVGRGVSIGNHEVWLGCQETVEGFLVAAVARCRPFTIDEDVVLARLVRSVAVAVGGEGPVLPEGSIRSLEVLGRSDWSEVDLCLELDGRRRRSRATGPTPELAVARAAAACCRPRCEVTFAGRTRLDDAEVTVVVVDDGAASPLLGIAVTSPGDEAGPVEAVVSAVSVVRPAHEGA
jgi:hypothetical protein